VGGCAGGSAEASEFGNGKSAAPAVGLARSAGSLRGDRRLPRADFGIGDRCGRVRGVSEEVSACAKGGLASLVVGVTACAGGWVGVSALGTVSLSVLWAGLSRCAGDSVVVPDFLNSGSVVVLVGVRVCSGG